MPLNLPFFRSGSNLIRDKLDKLQRSAAVTEKDRMDLGKLEKEKVEIDAVSKRVHGLEQKYKLNSEEISRRQAQISSLDKEAERLRGKMRLKEDEAVAHAKSSITQGENGLEKPEAPRAIPKAHTEELEKELAKIDRLRKIQSSEIQTLDDQNQVLDIHIKNARA